MVMGGCVRWGKVCEDFCKIENSNSSDMSFKYIHGPFISWMSFCFVLFLRVQSLFYVQRGS